MECQRERHEALGFGVWGLGLRDSGSGFWVEDVGFRGFRGKCSGSRVQG